MTKFMVLIVLCIYVICGFYLKIPAYYIKDKKGKFRGVVIDVLIYDGLAALLFFLLLPGMPWVYILSFIIAHTIFEIAEYTADHVLFKIKRDSSCNTRIMFWINQGFHFFLIVGVVYFINGMDIRNISNQYLWSILRKLEISGSVTLVWTTKLLLIHKPANALISNILEVYKPLQKGLHIEGDKNAGRIIGTLERIIMVILMSVGQYSAAGLVLTAKSIARYDRISKDQEFAEYYLLGTLLSTICAIAAAVAI